MQRSIKVLLGIVGAAIVFAAPFVWRFSRTMEYEPHFQNPYVSPAEFFEGIYAADHSQDNAGSYRIRAGILPHHLLATEGMARAVRMVATSKPKRIVLLSPDHFNRCSAVLCMTNGVFGTPFGDVQFDEDGIEKLQSPLVALSPTLFTSEHGIHAVLPYIKHYMSGATVVPLVLSQQNGWISHREELASLIQPLLDEDTVFLVSSDFSHYLPLQQAEDMDTETITALLANDLEGISKLENPGQSDCPGCLWLLTRLAGKNGFMNPSVLTHTNSARLVEDEAVPETTSHFSIVYYANARLNSDDAAFGGDITLTRGKPIHDVSTSISNFWIGDGPRILNLEGPLREHCETDANPYVFCNQVSLWKDTKQLATIWATENNHMFDQGIDGVTETINLISQEGDIPLGTDAYDDGNLRIVNFTTVLNPVRTIPASYNENSLERVMQQLSDRDPEKLTVVFLHHGTEYQPLLNTTERNVLEELIDAGADAVIAAHTHVPGDMWIYKGHPIFSGLGNMLFDQFDRTATQTAKLVRLRKENGQVLFETLTSR